MNLERHAEAEDLMQEILLKVFRSLDKFNQDADFSTWLGGIEYDRGDAVVSAYRRFGLIANQTGTYLATFKAVARKYARFSVARCSGLRSSAGVWRIGWRSASSLPART